MNPTKWSWRVILTVLAASIVVARVDGQVAKGLVDANVADEKELLALPHMTPAVVKGIREKRPFKSITELHSLLLSQSLTPEQLTQLYEKAFVHINLNTAARDEILLIPGAGSKMAHEFDEYRRVGATRSSTGRSASTWTRSRWRG